MLSVELTRSTGGKWSLQTSDLKGLRQFVGEAVFDSLCCCFVHADRAMSLMQMMSISRQCIPDDSIASCRNWTTFFFFLVGTLKELSLELGRFRARLNERGIWDSSVWERGLKRWEDWGNKHDSSYVRNALAFHVDASELGKGVSNVLPQDGEVLLQGDSPREGDSWCPLATLAQFRALEEEVADLKVTLTGPAALLAVSSSLQEEFIRILTACGIEQSVHS